MLILTSASTAQTGPQPLPGSNPRGFVQVAPNGAMLDAPSGVHFRIATDVVRQGDTLPDILQRNGLQDNPATVDAVRKLNPKLRFDLGKPKPGESLVFFAPEFSAGTNARVGLTEPTFSKAIVSTRRDEIVRTKLRADALGQNAFEHPADRQVFQAATADLADSAAKLEQASDKLDSRQLALSAFYLEQANKTVARVAAGSPNAIGKWDKSAVTAVEERMKPLRVIQKSIGTTSMPFSIRRKVTVQVVDGAGARVHRLRVYVLPISAIERPSDVSDSTMLSLLRWLSFEDRTSPASQLVEAADLAVWVGPDFEHEKMMQLVKRGAIKKFFIVSSAGARSNEVTHSFLSPKEVTQP